MKPVSRGVKERIISYINNGLPTFQIARKRYCVGHHCTMNKKEMLSKHNTFSRRKEINSNWRTENDLLYD